MVVELTGIGAGTLRGFERAGLVSPARTNGGTRRYSNNDLARLGRIAQLMAEGMNMAAIGRFLSLEDDHAARCADSTALRAEIAELTAESIALRAEIAALRAGWDRCRTRCGCAGLPELLTE